MFLIIKKNIRLLQITSLLTFYLIGYYLNYHQTSFITLGGYMISCVFFQFCLDQWAQKKFNWQSPIISSLSLTLLLKTHFYWAIILGSFLAIFSKIIRYKGQHFFNPTAFSITFGLIFLDQFFWVEVGQWGTTFFLWSIFIMCGFIVTSGAESRYVTLSFIVSFFILNFTRSWYLGDPIAILLHQFQSVGFMLFCFFMISDPRSTPQSLLGKVLFGIIISFVAFYFRFFEFESYFLYYALCIASFFTPILNSLTYKSNKVYRWALQ